MQNNGPSVLVLSPDTAAIIELRANLPLFYLKRLGLVQGYRVINPFQDNISIISDDFEFDVLWLQRITDITLIECILSLTSNTYVYDIDDLLIGYPSYVRHPMVRREGALAAMKNCRVLSASSGRLVGLLEAYSGLDLASKFFLCPNGFEFPQFHREPQPPKGLIWSSGDNVALGNSKEAVVKAVSAFSERYALPVYCFGYLDDTIVGKMSYAMRMGLVSYWHHKSLLANFPTMIGLAPLETHADQATLDFIAGKSDIKMVEYGGFGHPGVYSQSPPYVDSDLRCGILVPNIEKDWLNALEKIYHNEWRKAAEHQQEVRKARHMDVVAQHWLQALQAARMPAAISGIKLKQSLRRFYRHRLSGAIQMFYDAHPYVQWAGDLLPRQIREAMKAVLAAIARENG